MIKIREFKASDVPAVKKFTDENIGENYYTLEELEANQARSVSRGITTSFILVDEHLTAELRPSEKILGLRLAYGPGQWNHGKGSKLRPELWGHSIQELAYFQSLFVSESVRGMNFGPELSLRSIDAFKKLNAKAILTHSWKESPNNSSVRYLEKIGFKALAEHPEYWIDVDYVCTRDGKPCRCTAIEMLLELT